MTQSNNVRIPAVAGQFYPNDPTQLRETVYGLLQKQKIQKKCPKALIVPHAGYVYSGEIAAQVYAHIFPMREKIKRVILLGPAHRVAFRGIALSNKQFFATPLGNIPIDQEARELIISEPSIVTMEEAHAQEHSLEVQLPFLQALLPEFSLLPMVVGDATAEEIGEIIEKLWGGDETLIVISSDLSHFHNYDTAQQMDKATSEAIVKLIDDYIQPKDACGARPVNGLLNVAKKKYMRAKMVSVCNSGDLEIGDKERVVGYGGYVLYDDPFLVKVARQSIEYGINTGSELNINIEDYPKQFRNIQASFVTIKKDNKLRGCIGSLSAHRPLILDIAHNAYAAAFKDQRFTPLTVEEFREVDVSISILSPAEKMTFTSEDDLLNQIRPNIDGLILSDGQNRGTFLPSVWENIPDKKTFWLNLKQKAGLPVNHWSDSVQVERYTASYIE